MQPIFKIRLDSEHLFIAHIEQFTKGYPKHPQQCLTFNKSKRHALIIFTQRIYKILLLKHIFQNLLCYSDHTLDESLLPEKQIFVHIHRPEIAQRKLFGRRVGAFAFHFVHLHSFSLGEKGHCNKARRCARLTKAGTSCQKLQSVDKIWQ